MRMPFGKYQDRELTEVPRQYLRWLRTQPWLGAWLVNAIDDVLNDNVVAPSDESFEEVLSKWNEQEQSECGGD
jgi:hypothetical protein